MLMHGNHVLTSCIPTCLAHTNKHSCCGEKKQQENKLSKNAALNVSKLLYVNMLKLFLVV